jgi:hypothetical protein
MRKDCSEHAWHSKTLDCIYCSKDTLLESSKPKSGSNYNAKLDKIIEMLQRVLHALGPRTR